MRPTIPIFSGHSAILLPAAFCLTSTLSTTLNPVPHSLFVAAASWALIWIRHAIRIGLLSRGQNAVRGRLSWAAGACIAGAQLSQRAIRHSDGVLWPKALLPTLTAVIIEFGNHSTSHAAHPDDNISQEKNNISGWSRSLAIVTVYASLALADSPITLQNAALGLSAAVMLAIGLTLMRGAIENANDEQRRGGIVMANGALSRRLSGSQTPQEHSDATLRDLAAVLAVSCAVLSWAFESFRLDALTLQPHVAKLEGNWKLMQSSWLILQIVLAILVEAVRNVLLFSSVRSFGTLPSTLIILVAALIGRAFIGMSMWNLWFSVCAVLSIAIYADDTGMTHSAMAATQLRRKSRLLSVPLGVILCITVIWQAYQSRHSTPSRIHSQLPYQPVYMGDMEPLQLSSKESHPAEQLIQNADVHFQQLLNRQSESLPDAVAEYRRRYGIHPPPNFDQWFAFAKRRGVKLIDEFDTIHQALTPFWGLQPATIRARAKEALANRDNFLLGLFVRDGEVVNIDNGEEWQQQATLGMMKDFVQYLPDMDLAFNMHDEPRVIVPNDMLTRLVDVARNDRMPKAFRNASPRNAFSKRPSDLGDGKRIDPLSTSSFNQFAHQATWTHSILSCHLDSPARDYGDHMNDNLTSWALTDLGFMYNQTAFEDICNSPSLRHRHGFFDRPNAYNLALELFPIFSQSKLSSYQDIIYPSPWYWFNKVKYEEEKDPAWEGKINAMYWRGSTTGSFSRDGGWRRGHRQHVVSKMNGSGKVKILDREGSGEWHAKEVNKPDLGEIVDVHFSHVGQCEEKDCDAQKEFYHVTDMVDSQDAWQWKHLLDMDGNAFSGRFYAFLKSRSLVFKMAFFQEWHKDWLVPWVHFIPLSFRGDDWHELLRYFANEEAGMKLAPQMAMQSHQWANEVLRNEDFEVWFFRLLLEYGRVIDDDRENIGYPGP